MITTNLLLEGTFILLVCCLIQWVVQDKILDGERKAGMQPEKTGCGAFAISAIGWGLFISALIVGTVMFLGK